MVRVIDISSKIEAVYQRALQLRQHATELPPQPDLLTAALKELYFVLEELQTSQEDLNHQNQVLLATQQTVELERQRYQTLFELAPDGYLVTDRQGKIYQANRAAAQLFSLPQDYLIYKPLVVFVDESERSRFQTRLAKLNPVGDWELALNTRNGVQRWVAIAVTQLQGGAEKEDVLLWSLRDISLRKLMEQALQETHNQLEQRVQERTAELSALTVQLQQKIDEQQQAERQIQEQAALINITTDAIFVQDLDRRILFWNQGAERLYGWLATDILGQKTDALFCREPVTQYEAGFTQTIAQGSWHAELAQVTQTGRPIVVASRWTLVRDDSGHPKSILVVNTDITEQKQLETQFYRVQRIETLGTLASGIAHDLNNIFNPILLIAQMLQRQPAKSDAQSQEMLQTIVDGVMRGSDLIKQMLTFARKSPSQRITMQVDYVLREVTKIMQQTLPKSIQIHQASPPEPLALISGDPSQLHQVLMNLCVNARDAMPEGGQLTLTTENRYLDTPTQTQPAAQAGDYVVITVADTGSGISPGVMEHLFEPFFTTKDLGQGTGLGLATVFRIVKNHGGFIEVSSEVGQGSQFQVYLPAVTAPVTPIAKPAQLPSGQGEWVLIVDDELNIQKTTKIVLEAYQYNVLVASDGAAAIDLCAEHSAEIRVAIVDMMMPHVDGMATLQVLKTHYPQIRIIAVSGLPVNQQQALSTGADLFLAKPYTDQELLTRLHELIATA